MGSEHRHPTTESALNLGVGGLGRRKAPSPLGRIVPRSLCRAACSSRGLSFVHIPVFSIATVSGLRTAPRSRHVPSVCLAHGAHVAGTPSEALYTDTWCPVSRSSCRVPEGRTRGRPDLTAREPQVQRGSRPGMASVRQRQAPTWRRGQAQARWPPRGGQGMSAGQAQPEEGQGRGRCRGVGRMLERGWALTAREGGEGGGRFGREGSADKAPARDSPGCGTLAGVRSSPGRGLRARLTLGCLR